MEMEGFPPPPPEVLGNDGSVTAANEEEDEEGEQFDFDSGDEIPEADRQTILPIQEEENCIGNENLENLEEAGKMQSSKANAEGILPRVNPYSVITISPMQEKELLLSPEPSTQDGTVSPTLSSGYSVPVPCGYAVPSNLPLILPAYSSPVIIRNPSVDEEASIHIIAEDGHSNSQSSEEPPNSEDNQGSTDENALAKWVADPANTEWMESEYGQFL